jgi:hypothetical protein
VLSSIVTIRHESKKIERERKAEREKDLQTLVGRYLAISQDTVESLWCRLENIHRRGGTSVSDDEYYEVTTLYALARFFAIKQIMMLEGAYSNIEAAYPSIETAFLSMFTRNRRPEEERLLKSLAQEPFVRQTQDRFRKMFEKRYNKKPGPTVRFLLNLFEGKKAPGLGVRLLNMFEGIDEDIDNLVEEVLDDKGVPFHRYHRQQLGEAVMERELGQWKISKLLDFEDRYFPKKNGNRNLPDFLEAAKKFILALGESAEKMRPASVSRAPEAVDTKKIDPEVQTTKTFEEIMEMLQLVSDELSIVTGLPPRMPKDETIASK